MRATSTGSAHVVEVVSLERGVIAGDERVGGDTCVGCARGVAAVDVTALADACSDVDAVARPVPHTNP